MKSKHNASERAVPASTWIYNPWLDLIVGCGAWSAPLLLFSYLSVASSVRAWSVVFYALALFFNYPHFMATIYRAYHRAEDFQKYRIFTVHITALLALTLILSHSWVRILPWIFTIYLTWSPWHYSGQNYGLFMMFARRARSDPERFYASRTLRCLHRFLLDPVPGFPHRAFYRSSFHLNRNPGGRKPLGANPACGCVCCAGIFWTFAAGSGNRLAQAAAFAHIVLIAVPMVSLARGDFLDQRSGHSAESLQFRSAGGDAFGAIPLDYKLLCPARGFRRERPRLASVGLLRSADRRRHRFVCSRPMAGKPPVPP